MVILMCSWCLTDYVYDGNVLGHRSCNAIESAELAYAMCGDKTTRCPSRAAVAVSSIARSISIVGCVAGKAM